MKKESKHIVSIDKDVKTDKSVLHLYKRLLEFTGSGVYRYTFEGGVVLMANRGLVDILDLDCEPEELVGKRLADLLVYTERPGTVRDNVNHEGEVHNYEYHFRTLKGEDKWVLHNSFINFDGKTKIVEAIVRDVSERKKAEQALKSWADTLEIKVEERTRQLRDIQEQLVRTERLAAIGKLAGAVAHELRTPMGAMTNSIYFLKRRMEKSGIDDGGLIRKHLDYLEKEVNNSNKIIADILSFARIRTPAVSKVDLLQLIKGIIGEQELNKKIRFRINIDPLISEIEADPNQLKQVFSNLIANAVEAISDEGRINIGGCACGDYVEITIKDTGVGIPDDIVHKIFEPLFTTKEIGTGFGLSLCKNIVDQHNGEIDIDSKPNEGTCVRIKLPRKFQGGKDEC